MTPILKYYNQKIFVDEIEFPNYIIKNIRPELAIDSNVEEINYQEYGNNNYIIYNDNSKKELSKYEENLNKIIELKYNFEFEYKEDLFNQQSYIIDTQDPIINIRELIETGLTKEEQTNKIKIITEAFPNFILTNEILFEGIKKVKIQLLKASDWTQLPDVQESLSEEQKKEWVEYRATLRLLDDVKDPLTVRVPVLPKT